MMLLRVWSSSATASASTKASELLWVLPEDGLEKGLWVMLGHQGVLETQP